MQTQVKYTKEVIHTEADVDKYVDGIKNLLLLHVRNGMDVTMERMTSDPMFHQVMVEDCGMVREAYKLKLKPGVVNIEFTL